MPLSSFTLHDDVVYIETSTGEQQLYEPDEVTVYVKAFELLRAASATGPDAVALIQRIAAELRARRKWLRAGPCSHAPQSCAVAAGDRR